jgi:hypothetical protein
MKTSSTPAGKRASSARAALPLIGALLLLVPAAFAIRAVTGNTSAKRHRLVSFAIKGRLGVPLRPGASQRLNLKVINRRRVTLWVTRLKVRVSVDRRHRLAGCSARRDFAVRQLRRRAFPIKLRRRSARRLSALGVHRLPRLGMRDLAGTNQDACKGATLRLRYRGWARTSRPRGHRPRTAIATVGFWTP